MLYEQALSGAYTAPTGLPNMEQLNIDYNAASNNNANNVVSLALINYASIKPTAIADGYMYVANGQLHDALVAQRNTDTQNKPNTGPYQTNKLFIAAAVNNTAKNGVYNVLFNSNLFYTNTGLTVSSIQVDFGNGNGFVNAYFNTTLVATYTITGNKQLIYKLTFSDGSVAQCYNTVQVPYIPPANATNRYAEATIDPLTGADIPDVILNSATNAHAGVDLFIRRSISNAGSNTNPQFRRALIVVEGLDLSSATTLLGNGYNYNAFLDEIRDVRTNFVSGANPLQRFDQYLDDVAGYDLIFVNWHNGVDDITRNALALREVINYVNARKLPGAAQNVILGISMGGLVSRYCLAQMVKAGGTGVNETQTRLLITHDSPHRGANVPLALQHLLQRLRGQRVKAFLGAFNQRLDQIIPQFMDVNTAINSPAAEQQLLVRVTNDVGTVANNTFLDGVYRTMVNFDGTGITPPYRFVATSNGSQCGVPLADPYSVLASIDAEGIAFLFGIKLWAKGNTFIDMRRLPETGQTSRILDFSLRLKIKFLIFNLIKTSMQIQANAPGNLLPLDGLAGGTRDLGGAALAANVGSSLPAANGVSNWLIFGYSYSNTTPIVAASFSFVPTTSSLDVANFNAVNIPYTVPFTGLNGSRAANYIAQERITLPQPIGVINNVNHTDFFARTCMWLYNEMENITQTVTCQDQCSPEQITGTAEFCNSSNYSINLPAGTTVNWVVTPNPNGFVTAQANGNSVTLIQQPVTIVRNGNSGQITLTANYNSPACGSASVSKTIYVGARPPYLGVYAPNGNCPGQPFEAIASPYTFNYGTVSYNWYINGVLNSYHGYKLRSNFTSSTDTYIGVQIVTSNCGTSQETYQLFTCTNGRVILPESFTVSPIPAKSNITITGIDAFSFSAIKIVDKMGNIKKQWILPKNTKTANLNIAELANDIYYINVFNGKEWIGKSIIIQKKLLLSKWC